VKMTQKITRVLLELDQGTYAMSKATFFLKGQNFGSVGARQLTSS